MSLSPFELEKSDRMKRLFMVARPHIPKNKAVRILDVGCGYGGIAKFIHEKFPKADYVGFDSWGTAIKKCKKDYPYYTWILTKDTGFRLTKQYDIILHFGVDWKMFTSIRFIHRRIVNLKKKPGVVVLETGYRRGYPGPLLTMYEIRALYTKTGYTLVEQGLFPFDVENHHLKERRYNILRRENG